jgi:hypothetical protein
VQDEFILHDHVDYIASGCAFWALLNNNFDLTNNIPNSSKDRTAVDSSIAFETYNAPCELLEKIIN